VKVKVVWVVPDVGCTPIIAVMVGAVPTVMDAPGVVKAPPCETLTLTNLGPPSVYVQENVLSSSSVYDPATIVPPIPHCGLVKATVPVAVPPVRVAVK
jgi:hypothetical protein